MPNGNPKFHEEELPALETFFSQIAEVLNQFASRHDLMLEKYYHESHSWRCNFRHPRGGVATIEVEKDSDGAVKIYGYWWLDDYDKFSRFMKHGEPERLGLGDENLAALLEGKFREVLSWDLGGWTQTASGYEEFWKPMGKESIRKDVERYPQPKV